MNPRTKTPTVYGDNHVRFNGLNIGDGLFYAVQNSRNTRNNLSQAHNCQFGNIEQRFQAL